MDPILTAVATLAADPDHTPDAPIERAAPLLPDAQPQRPLPLPRTFKQRVSDALAARAAENAALDAARLKAASVPRFATDLAATQRRLTEILPESTPAPARAGRNASRWNGGAT